MSFFCHDSSRIVSDVVILSQISLICSAQASLFSDISSVFFPVSLFFSLHFQQKICKENSPSPPFLPPTSSPINGRRSVAKLRSMADLPDVLDAFCLRTKEACRFLFFFLFFSGAVWGFGGVWVWGCKKP